AALAALAAGYLFAWPELQDRAQFGVLSFGSGPPPRVDWCGRRYFAGTKVVTWPEILAFPDANRLTRILTTPSGEPVLAAPLTGAERSQDGSAACAMVVYVRLGAGRYLPYSLSAVP
ncbi:MAG: hypothetical protein ACREPA_03585, partial [Candidatus Dormibacteraceae bacterium]